MRRTVKSHVGQCRSAQQRSGVIISKLRETESVLTLLWVTGHLLMTVMRSYLLILSADTYDMAQAECGKK